MITDWTKTYEAVMLLGTVTDTQDTSGTVLKTREVNVTKRQILEVCSSFEENMIRFPQCIRHLRLMERSFMSLQEQG